MPDIHKQAELADAFRGETEALVELDGRIGRLMRERQRLETAFDALATAVDQALGRGEAPLALLSQLERIDAEIDRIEGELEKNLVAAVGRFE